MNEEQTLYDINEKEIDIFSLPVDDDRVKMLWLREMQIAKSMFDYYEPWLSRGKTAMDRYRGKVFSGKQLATFKNVENKYPIQPRIMKAPIMGLVGHIMNARRSGQVVTEGGFDVLKNEGEELKAREDLISVGTCVLNDLEEKTEEADLMRDMIHDALITCYPCWLMFEKEPENDGISGKVSVNKLPWDSTACGPFNWKKPSDINEFVYVDYVKEVDLIKQNPERKKAIKAHRDWMKKSKDDLYSSLEQWEGAMSAADRDRMFSHLYQAISAAMSPDGWYEVYTRLFQVENEEEVAVNLLDPDRIIVRAPDWDGARWDEVIEQAKTSSGAEYEKDTRNIKILWVTKFSSCGLMIDNRKHWFQNNAEIPGKCYVPMIVDEVPDGPGIDYAESALKVAVAETEFLDAIRKSGKLLVMRSGYIENIDAIPKEVSKNVGAIFVKRDAPMLLENVIKDIDRRPSTAMGEYAEKIRKDMQDESAINRTMLGASAPSQADVAKQTEVSLGLVVQSIYVRNVNRWWSAWQNLKCKIIPYAYSKLDILEVNDRDTAETKLVYLNYPKRGVDGSIAAIINDVTSVNFRWKIAPVDDSATAKQMEWQQAMIFLNSAPGPLMTADPTGNLLADFMTAMGQENRILKHGAKILKEEAKKRAEQQAQSQQSEAQAENQVAMQKLANEAEKNRRQGITMSFTGQDLKEMPQLATFLQQIGYFDNVSKPQQQPQQPPAEVPAE